MKEVRGKGLMIGVEFGPPKSMRLKASWNVLETANKGLFCQLITVPLFKDQKILTQVSGHGSHTIKLLPPLTITDEDCNWIETAFDTVIADSHRVPGAIWSLGGTDVDTQLFLFTADGHGVAFDDDDSVTVWILAGNRVAAALSAYCQIARLIIPMLREIEPGEKS